MRTPVATRLSPRARWRGLPLQDVTLTGGFRPLQTGAGVEPQGGQLTAIPYFAWANRQPGPMRVWIPLRQTAPAPPG
jgi:hypothetical protein